ncbi:MAG TPA: stalk domain-containing protein [Symbiobacteriaceae bacterium]
MKRRLFSLLTVISLLLASVAGVAQGQSSLPIRVFVDGDQVNFPDQLPTIVDGRTLVPLRGVFETMGATVDWNADALRATVRLRGHQVAVFIGSRTAWVNGSQKTLDVAPRLIGGRTMVPLRFIAEAFGLEVGWEDRQRAVIIGAWPAMPVLAPYGDPDLEMPCTLRVAMREMGSDEPDPNGKYVVKEVDLANYVADVLGQEFGDFKEDEVIHRFGSEALKAGAMAILMYAWYHAWNPAKPNYDLDNSNSFQVYIPGKAEQKHRDAVKAIWGQFMVLKGDGDVFAPQHGRGWYGGRSQGTDWMNQRGSAYLADKGYSWDEILQYYYNGIAILQHPNPCAGLN